MNQNKPMIVNNVYARKQLRRRRNLIARKFNSNNRNSRLSAMSDFENSARTQKTSQLRFPSRANAFSEHFLLTIFFSCCKFCSFSERCETLKQKRRKWLKEIIPYFSREATLNSIRCAQRRRRKNSCRVKRREAKISLSTGL